MKKTILFSFILITIIAFSGCSSNVPQISQEDIKSQLKEELKSEIKEELKVGLKEELKSELKEELTKELAGNIPGGTAKPGSLELTADYCYFPEMPGYFSCRYGFLWEEGVEFKMRYLQAGRAVLKKIWFTELDCGIDLPEEPKYNLGHLDEVLFDIPCNITKDSFYNNEIQVTFDYHMQSNNRTYSITEMITTGELGGIVRDRETFASVSNAQVTVVEECSPPPEWPFACTKHTIGKDYIDLRLKVDGQQGLYVVKSIEFPAVPCAFKPETISKERGLKLNEEYTFHIPCEMKRDYVKSMLELTYDYYQQKKVQMVPVPGEYEAVPQEQLVAGGWVAGIIK